MTKIGTIREIQTRLNADGYHISEYALRLWIKTGLIPAVYVGTKALISYDAVLSHLTGSVA